MQQIVIYYFCEKERPAFENMYIQAPGFTMVTGWPSSHTGCGKSFCYYYYY